MDCQQYPAFKTLGLADGRSLEWLLMVAEPDLNNAIAANPVVDATGNGLYLRQFRHLSIVGEARSKGLG